MELEYFTPPAGTKTETDCCALCQLSRINNGTSIEFIQKKIDQLRAEKEANVEVGISTGNGQTAVFTIVSPGEFALEANLIKLGFKNVHQFERRRGYPQMGDLTMYILNL